MLDATSNASLEPSSAPPAGARPELGLSLLIAGVGLATVAAVVLTGGNPAAAVAPVLGVTLAWVVSRVPLRWSVNALLIALLALDENGESYGQWRTPLAKLGDALHYRLDKALGVPGMAVAGVEVALVALFALWLWRRVQQDPTDSAGQIEIPRVVRDVLLIYLAGVAFSAAFGLARGLPIAPWKVRNLIHPVLLLLLFLVAYRGPLDHRAIGRVVVFAACAKAVLAVVVQRIAIAQTGGRWECATTHGDSVLFAVAVVLLVGSWLERPRRRELVRMLLLLPIILLGASENERRIVWPMIGLGLILVYAVAPMRGWKRSVTRAALLALPVGLLYVGVGWDRGGRIFKPVQTLRSMADTSVNRSAFWREVEIWNITMSMRWSPVTGVGLGGEYTEYMMNDRIADAYKEYREWPHNTVLGLLLLMGVFGFTAQWLLLPLAVFLAARAYRFAGRADDRVAAIGSLAAVAACLVMAYGDTGAHYTQYKVFAALAVAVAAKLAVATGAWPSGRGQRATRPGAASAPSPLTSCSYVSDAALHG